MTSDTIGTGRFLWRMATYRTGNYVADTVIWIGMYLTQLLPGLIAQQAFDRLQHGTADVPAILWFAALFVGAGAANAGLLLLGWIVDVGFRFGVTGVLQRNMLMELLRRPGARSLDRTPGEALSVFRDDVEHAENGADWTIDMIGNGSFSALDPALFKPIVDTLLGLDHYLLLADYSSYIACQDEVDKLYLQPHEWARTSILNTAAMGKFSSDRTIAEYAREIWDIKPEKISRHSRRDLH